jgi:hypothetical protein
MHEKEAATKQLKKVKLRKMRESQKTWLVFSESFDFETRTCLSYGRDYLL